MVGLVKQVQIMLGDSPKKEEISEMVEKIERIAGVVGDKARSFQGDRKMLTAFLFSTSFNVGEISPTVHQENPNIIQTELKQMDASELILSIANDAQWLGILRGIALDSDRTEVGDTMESADRMVGVSL